MIPQGARVLLRAAAVDLDDRFDGPARRDEA